MVRPTLCLGACLMVACGGSTGGEPDTLGERKREILSHVGEQVIVATLGEFVDEAVALESACAAWAASPDDAAARERAQQAWVAAMAVWERAEMMQVGPQGMSGITGTLGGMDRRDEIYSWPTRSSCQVDQRTVTEAHADVDLLGAELVDTRGLDALEYLLFVEGDGNQCSTASPLNAAGTWAAFSVEEILTRRARYASTAAALVAREAAALHDLWNSSFLAELAGAGDGSETFSSAQAALDDLAGAMLYLDNEARDMKVGEPAGIVGCPSATCLEALESPYAHRSREHVLANVQGFSALFHGGAADDPAALGFDDLLVDLGQGELAARMSDAIVAAIAALEALPGTLELSIESDAAAVSAAYDALGIAQRLFKVDVVTALDLEPSSTRVGDND